MPKIKRKPSKPKPDPILQRAREIDLPAAQIRRGDFVLRDVANHSEADQRRMVRSGEKTTLQRLTRVEQLARAGVINAEQALACEWYVTAHELGFQTIGCTANYEGAGGGGFGSTDLLARYRAQAEARANYHYARQAIPGHLLATFEAIVLGRGRPPQMLPKQEKLRFSMAAFLLHGQIGHLLAIAA